MSSHDSISMVLKCMLKGAADFLIKPIRRNELRNLWQHVWRRHTVYAQWLFCFSLVELKHLTWIDLSCVCFTFYQLAAGLVPHNLPATEHKVEATAENNAESNQSSDYGSSTQKNKEGSDTQVSIFLSFDIGLIKGLHILLFRSLFIYAISSLELKSNGLAVLMIL